jgi:hypothetical protein
MAEFMVAFNGYIRHYERALNCCSARLLHASLLKEANENQTFLPGLRLRFFSKNQTVSCPFYVRA